MTAPLFDSSSFTDEHGLSSPNLDETLATVFPDMTLGNVEPTNPEVDVFPCTPEVEAFGVSASSPFHSAMVPDVTDHQPVNLEDLVGTLSAIESHRPFAATDDVMTLPSEEKEEPAVKLEDPPFAVEPTTPTMAKRPKRGAGSRRKIKEKITSPLDNKIYSLFPREVLRLPQVEFRTWREQSGVRPLSSEEQKCLSKIRRMFLSREYADRARLGKKKEAEEKERKLTALMSENGRLKKKTKQMEKQMARLEKALAVLQARGMTTRSQL